MFSARIYYVYKKTRCCCCCFSWAQHFEPRPDHESDPLHPLNIAFEFVFWAIIIYMHYQTNNIDHRGPVQNLIKFEVPSNRIVFHLKRLFGMTPQLSINLLKH